VLWEKYVACVHSTVQLALELNISDYFPTIPGREYILPDFATEIVFSFDLIIAREHLEISIIVICVQITIYLLYIYILKSYNNKIFLFLLCIIKTKSLFILH